VRLWAEIQEMLRQVANFVLNVLIEERRRADHASSFGKNQCVRKNEMIEFKPYSVAYLDILGFSRFVEDAEKNQDKLEQLNKLFSEVIPREISDNGRNREFPSHIGLNCLSCSDSIVVSAPVTDGTSFHALTAVSIKAIQIAHALLDMGFLVRGAIAVGNVYRTDSNIFGTGYQKAVEAEKEECYPRIVLAESAEQVLNDLIKNGQRFSIFTRDERERIILDSIYPHQNYLPDPTGGVDEYFRRYRGTIIKNLTHDDPKAKEKWRWFAGLFNANVRYFSEIHDDNLIEAAQILPNVTINYLNPQEENSVWMDSCKAPGVQVVINRPPNKAELP